MPPPPSAFERGPVGWIQRFVDIATRWLWLPTAIGLLAGVTAWAVAHFEVREYLVKNTLEVAERRSILWWGLVGVVSTWGAYVVAWLLRRRREPSLGLGQYASRVNRLALLALTVPLFAAQTIPAVEKDEQLLTLLMMGIIIVLFIVTVYRYGEGRPPPAKPVAKVSRGARIGVALAILFYGVMFTYMSVLDHHNLGTHAYDLGIYDNLLWRTSQGDFLQCSICAGGTHLSGHFDPILVAIVPFYWVYPHAETLLVFQSVWLATAGLPLFLIARRHMPSEWHALGIVVAFVLYPALHGANMFDFHSLTLVTPLLFWAVFLLDSGRLARYWPVLALILLTREDMPLLACFIGAYAFITGHPRTGLATVVVAATYLVCVKMFIMTDSGLLMSASKDSVSHTYFYSDMIPHRDQGAKGLVITFFANPAFTLKVLFLNEAKITYFLKLLIPLLFMPLFGGKKRVLMIYGAAFIGLASRTHVYSLHFQYGVTLFPFLFMALPEGIMRFTGSRFVRALRLDGRRLMRTIMAGLIFSTALVGWKYGGLLPNKSFKAGWNRLNRLPDEDVRNRYRAVHKFADQIPADAPVSASSHLCPQVSNRELVYKWPSYTKADYLLLDKGKFNKKSKKRIDRLVKRFTFREVDVKHGIALYERVPEDERAGLLKEARAKKAAKKKKKTKRRDRKPPDGKEDPDAKAKDKDKEEGDGDGEDEEDEEPDSEVLKEPGKINLDDPNDLMGGN